MGVKNTKPTIRPEIAGGKKKKVSGPTQHTPMERVLVLKNGRRKVMEWQEWTK
jgi:hypothetical protein